MSQIMIHHGTQDLSVNIIIVNCRCIDVAVNDDLSIDMRVPIGMKWSMIENYVRMNEHRILREYEQKKMRNHQVLPVTLELANGRILYRSGQKLPFMGRMDMQLRVKYVSEEEETKLFVDEGPNNQKVLTIKTDNDSQDFLRYCIMQYYKKCAGHIVNRKVKDFGNRMQLKFNQVQITSRTLESSIRYPKLSYKNIEIKDQKTLWGSCSKKRNLRFDWKLAMLPVEVIDYIIVHELTHLKKMNHSDAFWTEMERVMPEYKECRNWLNKHGKEYEIF